jgi:hypothetical protein
MSANHCCSTSLWLENSHDWVDQPDSISKSTMTAPLTPSTIENHDTNGCNTNSINMVIHDLYGGRDLVPLPNLYLSSSGAQSTKNTFHLDALVSALF